jgi:short-subunit dehydrogenase
MNYLVLGASAGLGRAIARKLASEGNNLILLATDDRDLQAVASDLVIRHGVRVETLAVDVSAQTGYLDDLERIIGRFEGMDGILCPIGAVDPEDYIHYAPAVLDYIHNVNYASVVAVITRFWDVLLQSPHHPAVVGFGSVASIRGRNANVHYAAAIKALLSYFESLRHAAASTQVLVQFYVVGYLDTNQAFGKRTLLPRAHPMKLASRVHRNLAKDFGVAYHPRYWHIIHLALRLTPWAVFKRLTF